MAALVGISLAAALVLAGVLVSWSPGRPKPAAAGGISEKIRVNINGVEQGMFIEGKDASKPVLLFVHGGPGMPEYFLNRTHPTGLEDDFVVCWWEQRGSGLSYSSNIDPESMTVDQLVSDTIEVSKYLRGRFHQDKIYLMAHSWGSFIGIKAAARAPELYHAYIGMGQVSYQLKSEKESYDFELAQFRQRGDSKMVRALEQAPVTMTPPLPARYMAVRDQSMHSLGVGTTRDMDSVVTGIFVPVWQSPDYSVSEKIDIGRGKKFSQHLLWDQFLTTDLTAEVPELKVPAYFFHGKHDHTVSYAGAKGYFEKLKAPRKQFYTFEDSAHSPLFEEPAKARQILREDVVAGGR